MIKQNSKNSFTVSTPVNNFKGQYMKFHFTSYIEAKRFQNEMYQKLVKIQKKKGLVVAC